MRKWLPICISILLLLPCISHAQAINGRVLNEEGKNADNVTVNVKNTRNISNTKPDGRFDLKNIKIGDTLVFSAIGMETYQVIVNQKNIVDRNFEVVMLNQRKKLDDVVVTTYSVRREAKNLGYSTASTTPTETHYRVGSKVSGLIVSNPGDKNKVASTTAKKPEADGMESFFEPSRGGAAADFKAPLERPFYIRDTARITAARTKLMTAGEINDFNKWKMWSDYNAADFRTYSINWGMHSNNRFSVQLSNKSHNAVVNMPVYLINKITGDTAWKAYTDNTGKAELWAGFFKDSVNAQDFYIADSRGNKINSPAAFANGVNNLQTDQSCGVSQDVDIAFVVDATGSMGDEIEFLKLEIEDVIRKTMDKYQALSLRAASVFYRDKRDEYLTRNTPFNDDLLKTANFIKLQSAAGGGDYPEAVEDALSVALDSIEWNSGARTRLLFLVLDAPPHNEAKERIQRLTQKAAAMGVRIIPIACSGTDKSTEFLLRSMALATNGTYTFLTNHSGVGNSHIEPTTDKYDVELLNELLQRVIGQCLYAKDCKEEKQTPPEVLQPDNVLRVKLYPNPTTGRFTIECNKEIKEIYITDFTGKILMKLGDATKKGKWQVDISNYPSGMYLVKYVTAENKWGAEKVILMR